MDNILFFVSVLLMALRVLCGPIGDSKVTGEDSMDGEYMLKLGQSVNEPLLVLLGKVLINTDNKIKSYVELETKRLKEYVCKMHECSEWSDWTPCSVTILYGVSVRTRVCGIASFLCPVKLTTPTKERETRLCRGLSPENYTVTANTDDNIKSTVQTDTEHLKDNICQTQTECSEWSDWTPCSVKKRYGEIERTKTCEIASLHCPVTLATPTIERETIPCKGWCPDNYTVTDNGFCLRQYDIEMTYADGTALCQSDGGHVVNINSQDKSDDTQSDIIESQGLDTDYWINGQRLDSYSSWEVTYENDSASFSNWGNEEPESTDLCRVHRKGGWWFDKGRWHGRPCTSNAIVICEVKSAV